MLQARAPQIGVRAPSSCHPRRAAMWGRQTPVQAQRPDLVGEFTISQALLRVFRASQRVKGVRWRC